VKTDRITWTQDSIADVPLQRFTAHAGAIEVGYVEYDGGNRMWVWSSRLADDAWGWGSTAEAAKHGLEASLRRKHPVRTAVERGGRSMLRSRREVGLSGVPVPGK
jgi:hypothetical protein